MKTRTSLILCAVAVLALVAVWSGPAQAVTYTWTPTAANTSLISIGSNVAYTTDCQTELAPGDTWTIVAPEGTKEDLKD